MPNPTRRALPGAAAAGLLAAPAILHAQTAFRACPFTPGVRVSDAA